MDILTKDENFRKWVESLPDEYWAKKDLSACRMGWDAALEYVAEKIYEAVKIKSLELSQGLGDQYLTIEELQHVIKNKLS